MELRCGLGGADRKGSLLTTKRCLAKRTQSFVGFTLLTAGAVESNSPALGKLIVSRTELSRGMRF